MSSTDDRAGRLSGRRAAPLSPTASYPIQLALLAAMSRRRVRDLHVGGPPIVGDAPRPPPPPRVDVQTDWTNFNNFAGCLRQPPSIGRRRSPPVGRRPGRSTAGLDFRFELFRLPAFWGAVRPQRRRRGLSAEPRLSGSSSISWISGAAAAVSRHRALPRRALCVWPESQRRGRQKLRRFWQRRREFRRIDTRCEEVTRG